MTRRDYEQIARVICGLDIGEVTRCRVAQRFADELEVTDPRFDRTRFLTACVPMGDSGALEYLERRGEGEQV